ncbi:uncharacterized protein LOC125821043 [Solanum verrucosum]|uniref:uncharacterized protein LOC125821043 n=1 Tax=Solanum verrucosum TaxID=315347 RepID=UPI0020D06077|nr:uncharacterized protein LOC125821043 [Solanum verrucosum]
MNLVSTVFDRKSYGGWRRVVIIVLCAKNKPGFTDGSLVIPIADLAFQKAWSCCNGMIFLWLLNSLSKEIVESVLYSQSDKELWSDLDDRFGQTNDFKFTKQKRFLTLADNAYHAIEEVDQGGSGFSNAETLTQENIGKLLQ